MDAIAELIRAKMFSAPFIAIRTADQFNTLKKITDKFNSGANAEIPVIKWNIIDGVEIVNSAGNKIIKNLMHLAKKADTDSFPVEGAGSPLEKYTDIKNLLIAGKQIPEDSIIVLLNAHKYFNDIEVLQATMLLRNHFAKDRKTLVFLGSSFALPEELAQDFFMIEEALPTPEEIKTTVTTVYKENEEDLGKIPDSVIETAAEALRGLSPFSMEQAASLSIRIIKNKMVVCPEDLWARKKEMINSVPGLKMESWGPTFDDIGGLLGAKSFINDKFHGPNPPVCIVFIDEVEKMLSGSSTEHGDTSGTSQDAAKILLTNIEDNGWGAQTLVGPPGTCKTFFAKCVASTYKCPIITFDGGAVKGSHVGDSEKMIRNAMRTLLAIAGRGAYFIVTCNKLHVISPEMRRRFGKFGIWFASLPTAIERVSIGKLQTAAFNLRPDQMINHEDFWKKAHGWSGANVRDACMMAYDLNLPLEKAVNRVVPALKMDPIGIRELQRLARGKFLDCAKEGIYEGEDIEEETLESIPEDNKVETRKFKTLQ